MAKALAEQLKNQALDASFELQSRKYIDSLMIEVTVSRHVKTGAVHYHLAHNSDENAFMVAFRTQPMDSKGTAHVLEHTALCGSQKYPVRDPFFSMIKRSLQTFMNAFTASDWTAYPFATQNQKDFDNLLSVYLDAAFFPNLHPLDFAQEGIRVELNDEGYPEFKGIVFNEMKGAMSGEIEQLYHALSSALHPETTYHYNSGGDPEFIPELTHQDLIDFHQAHYHPSNSIIMSFGNRELADIQSQCDKQALSHFTEGKKFTSIPETRLQKPIHVTESYAVDELKKQQTHHVVSWLLPNINDPKTRLTVRLIEGILIEHSGSPLRALLESSPYGTSPSPLMGMDDNNFEMVFYAGIRGSEPEYYKDVEQSILDLLTDVANKPIDKSEIDMVLHQIELNQKQIGGDGMPYGLTLMLDGLSAAVHDGNAIDIWEVQPHLDWLNEQLKDDNWLPNQIKSLFIDNPHRVMLSLLPDDQKAKEKQAKEDKKLQKIYDELDSSYINLLKQQASELAERQSAEDDLSLLPKISFEDIPKEIEFANGECIEAQLFGAQSKIHKYTAGTNGIYYAQVIIPVSQELLANPLCPYYTSLIGELGTEQYNSAEFQSLQASNSGGIGIKFSQRTSLESSDEFDAYIVLTVRALNRKLEALDILKHCMEQTVFTESKRAFEILSQKNDNWQNRLVQSGHAYALQAANSSLSELAKINFNVSGIPALARLSEYINSFENEASLIHLLGRIADFHRSIMSLPKQVLLVCEDKQMPRLEAHINQHWQDLSLVKPSQSQAQDSASVITKNTAWMIQTNVYHHAMSIPTVPVNHQDTPALMVLGNYIKNNYLHRAIREQGGAYGAGAGYDANACSFRFFSYRDPRALETYRDFSESIRWLVYDTQKPEWLEEAILGIIASVDKPGSPSGEAIKICMASLHGRTAEWQSELRKRILNVSLDDLIRVAKTYLLDQTGIKVTIAPHGSDQVFADAGFDINSLNL